jgi:hypothetical protein
VVRLGFGVKSVWDGADAWWHIEATTECCLFPQRQNYKPMDRKIKTSLANEALQGLCGTVRFASRITLLEFFHPSSN